MLGSKKRSGSKWFPNFYALSICFYIYAERETAVSPVIKTAV